MAVVHLLCEFPNISMAVFLFGLVARLVFHRFSRIWALATRISRENGFVFISILKQGPGSLHSFLLILLQTDISLATRPTTAFTEHLYFRTRRETCMYGAKKPETTSCISLIGINHPGGKRGGREAKTKDGQHVL